jgi:hypothetical protein
MIIESRSVVPAAAQQNHLRSNRNTLSDRLQFRERLGPDEGLLLLGRHGRKQRNVLLAASSAPHVRARVEVGRQALSFGLLVVDLCNLDDLALDVGEGVEGDVGQVVLVAVLLEAESAAGKEDVGFAGGGEVGDAVTDEDDHGDGAVVALEAGRVLEVVDGLCLVVAELGVVEPDGLPLAAVRRDGGVVGDDVDVCRVLLAEEVIEDPAKNGLETGGDDVKGNAVVDAELVEGLEVDIDLECFLHHFEAVVEGHIERAPHLFRHIAERALATVDLVVEFLSSLCTAAEGIEEDVAGILHEDRSIEVYTIISTRPATRFA